MRDEQQVADIARGGYILRQETSDLELILIATGSEVELVMAAAEALAQGCAWFLCHRPVVLINKILITVTPYYHQTARGGWLWRQGIRMVGINMCFNGSVIGMRTFGESGPVVT